MGLTDGLYGYGSLSFGLTKNVKKNCLSSINRTCLVSVIIKRNSGLIYSSQFILFYFILFFFRDSLWDSRELGCLPFDRKVRLGCRKHNGKRFIRLPEWKYYTSIFGWNFRKVTRYHLPSIRNFWNFLSNGKHPWCTS